MRQPRILRGNTFQPNLLAPVNSEADYAGSHPSITVSGNSVPQSGQLPKWVGPCWRRSL